MNVGVPKLFSAHIDGIDAQLIEIEADIHVGLHAFTIVGLADKAVNEARERVNSALKNCGIKAPTRENRRITVNLAPAHTKKAGSHFDLPIALAYLSASNQIAPFYSEHAMFLGELSLDGTLRPVHGVLNMTLLAREKGLSFVFVPALNAPEAALVSGIQVFPVHHLKDLIFHLEGSKLMAPLERTSITPTFFPSSVSINDIKGQEAAKRSLLVAAAGGHNLLFFGPPGTGKTMLAQSFTSLLPPPSHEEIIEITRVHSVAGSENTSLPVTHRPFRAPHHSASLSSLVGGGTNPRPGEISLAHRGVLFLDEAPEFRRDALESLRQPLESRSIHVSRAKKQATFPASFILLLAMNPCPCGYFGDTIKECRCTAHEVLTYQKKLSGPLLDRVDIQIEIPHVRLQDLRHRGSLPPSSIEETFRAQIQQARTIQRERFSALKLPFLTNSDMSSKHVDALLRLDSSAESFLEKVLHRSLISPRGYYRILKVAQTIADLDASPYVRQEHLGEAFHYRIKTLADR